MCDVILFSSDPANQKVFPFPALFHNLFIVYVIMHM